MNFDEIIVKDNPGICRCCLSEGCYKDLGTEYTWMNETEVYADMLLDCFDISILQHSDGPNGPKRLICEVCITRLRDACNFKKQVLDSEKRFIDMLARGDFRNKGASISYQSSHSNMKQESTERTEVEDVLNADIEYLDDMDFGDDEPLKSEAEQSTSKAGTSEVRKSKRGRPRKDEESTVKPKKAKIPKGRGVEKTINTIKPKTFVTMRNRSMKENAVTLLKNTTILPFKWHCPAFLCFFCNRPLKFMDEVRQHTQDEHTLSNVKSAVSIIRRDDKIKVDVSYARCKLCGQTTPNLNDMVNHLKSAHEVRFNEGEIGLIPYKLAGDRAQCAICEQHFACFSQLNQHMNKHYNGYVCDSCGKSFLSFDRLRCHKLSHRSQFACAVCGESFPSMAQKKVHANRAHDKPKLLKCEYCDETFPSYKLRKLHYKNVHNVDIPEYKCPVCDKSFLVLSRMTTHVREAHDRERNFACSECSSSYFSKSRLVRHALTHTEHKSLQCDPKKTFDKAKSLRGHVHIHNLI